MAEEIYNGAMYEATGAGRDARRAGLGVRAGRDVLAEEGARMGQERGRALAVGQQIMQERESYIRRSRADIKLREVDRAGEAELNEGFSAVNGSEGSFYDAWGNFLAEKAAGVVAKHQAAAEGALDGVVDPGDRTDIGQRVRAWQVEFGAKAEAKRAVSVRQRARAAFEARYKAAMDMNDFETAGEMAREAAQKLVIDEDTANLYDIGAQKGHAMWKVEEMVRNGDIVGLQRVVDGGELNRWMSPLEQERLLRQGQAVQKQRAMEEVERVWSLPADEIGKAKRPWEVTGSFTRAQVRLIKRMQAGEDVSVQLRKEAINEARAFPATGDYEQWEAGYIQRWKALGLNEGEISKALSEAHDRRKRLGNIRQVEAAVFEESIRNTEGAVVPGRMEELKKTLKNVDWIKENGAVYGVTPEDSDADARKKYMTGKAREIVDEVLVNVRERYNEWLDSDEGLKSTPQEQRLKYEDLWKEEGGAQLELRNVNGFENAYQGIAGRQAAVHAAYYQGGLMAVDYSAYPARLAGSGEVGIMDGDDKEVGVYLPERMRGQVKAGKDGVVCIGEHGGCRELPVLGFVKGEQMQISRGAAAEMAVNPKQPPRWDWQVVRADEYERLEGIQRRAAGAAELKQRRAYTPPSVSAARVMRQPGYNEPIDAERVKSYMGPQLAAHYDTFLQAAKENNLDPRLLIAIAMNESAKGTSYAARTRNNLFGRWDPNAINPRTGARGYHKYYRNVDESIRDIARNLRRNYLDKGYTSIETIARKYAPVGAENDPRGLNGGWPAIVGKFYQQLSNL